MRPTKRAIDGTHFLSTQAVTGLWSNRYCHAMMHFSLLAAQVIGDCALSPSAYLLEAQSPLTSPRSFSAAILIFCATVSDARLVDMWCFRCCWGTRRLVSSMWLESFARILECIVKRDWWLRKFVEVWSLNCIGTDYSRMRWSSTFEVVVYISLRFAVPFCRVQYSTIF